MWTTEELGLAVWKHAGSAWYVDARGGKLGISIADSFSGASRYMALSPVDEDRLPSAAEQYVRGDEWHVNFPQGDHSYALRLVFQPIETRADQLVMEVAISLQTDLLELHPKLDIEVDCHNIDSFVPQSPYEQVTGSGSAPISLAKDRKYSTSVLLGPQDSPFTTNHSSDMLLRLRLFGDFLEKGVIRRVRPWFVITRGQTPPTEQTLEAFWKQLCDSPLPLT
jgi:hypothetical protein